MYRRCYLIWPPDIVITVECLRKIAVFCVCCDCRAQTVAYFVTRIAYGFVKRNIRGRDCNNLRLLRIHSDSHHVPNGDRIFGLRECYSTVSCLLVYFCHRRRPRCCHQLAALDAAHLWIKVSNRLLKAGAEKM